MTTENTYVNITALALSNDIEFVNSVRSFSIDADNVDIMHFNQFGGICHPQWEWNIKVAEYKFDDEVVDGKRRLYY